MDPFDWMLRDSLQHLTQIILGIERMQLCRLGQQIDRGSPLATGIGPGEQPVLPIMLIFP